MSEITKVTGIMKAADTTNKIISIEEVFLGRLRVTHYGEKPHSPPLRKFKYGADLEFAITGKNADLDDETGDNINIDQMLNEELEHYLYKKVELVLHDGIVTYIIEPDKE